jgi:hypothetical protein
MTEIVHYVLYTHVGEVGSAPISCPQPPPTLSPTHHPNHNRSSKKLHFYAHFIVNIFRFILIIV